MTDAQPYRFVSDEDLKAVFRNARRWPFEKMVVGQILEIPADENLPSAVNAYFYVAKKNEWKFKRRTLDGSTFIKRVQ